MIILLYNSKGDYLAFKKEEYLYDVDGRWIGFFDGDETIAYDTKGHYLGTILGNRLYRDYKKVGDVSNKVVKFAGYPEMFKFPKPVEEEELPADFTDVKIKIPLF